MMDMILNDWNKHYKKRVAGSKREKKFIDCLIKLFSQLDYICYQDFFALKTTKFSRNLVMYNKTDKNKYIIISAHSDCSNQTHGMDDNISGILVCYYLMSLLKNVEFHNFNVVVIIFGSEETGLLGSKHFIDSLNENNKKEIKLLLNIDSVGVGDFLYVYSNKIADEYRQMYGNLNKVQYQIKSKIFEHGRIGLWGDHKWFDANDIPYLFFERTNWNLDVNYGQIQTKEFGRIMHTKRDNYRWIKKNIKNRFSDNIMQLSFDIFKYLEYLDGNEGGEIIETTI